MPKVTKTMVEQELRKDVFDDIFNSEGGVLYDWKKINDRQYGVLLIDANGEQRYVRIGAIVAALREDMTAEELMQSEIEEYQMKQKAKAETAKATAAKIAKDKARREKEKEKKKNDVQ